MEDDLIIKRRFLKYYLIKLYVKLMLVAGSLLSLNRKRLYPKQIIKILINRSDRLGDAIISIPIINNLRKNYEVTVLSSKYNDFIFKKAGIKTIPIESDLLDQNQQTLHERIKRYTSSSKIAINSSDFDAYLNFSGTRVVRFRQDSKDILKIGFKFGISPLHCNFVVPTFHSQVYAKCLIDMIKLVDSSFSYLPKPEDLKTLQSESQYLNEILPDKQFILFHVGGKSPRLLIDDDIITLLNSLPYLTLVVDSPDQATLKKIACKITNPNIKTVDKELDLFELFSITSNSKCKLFVGYDTGSSHLLQWPTNALIIFTTGDHNAWRPFTGNEWKTDDSDPNFCFEQSHVETIQKCISYRPLKCRPCYDLMCPDPECKTLNTDGILKKIISLVKLEY